MYKQLIKKEFYRLYKDDIVTVINSTKIDDVDLAHYTDDAGAFVERKMAQEIGLRLLEDELLAAESRHSDSGHYTTITTIIKILK